MGTATAFIPACFAIGTSSSSSSSSSSPSVSFLHGGRSHHQLCRFRLASVISPLSHRVSRPFSAHAISSSSSSSSSANEEQRMKDNIATNPVVVYSKSYCPSLLGTVSKARERERLVFLAAGGNEVQAALQRFTGQYTVPNVFIGGKHIGGCDDTVALHQRGKLIPLLKDSGVNVE